MVEGPEKAPLTILPAPHELWANRIIGESTEEPGALLANPSNWRKHPSGQREQMKAALQGVGWIQRVIVNKRTGRIVDGHLRAELAAERGSLVPVVWVDLSEEEERLALATFDFLASQAESDKAQVKALLQEIEKDASTLLTVMGANVKALLDTFKIGREPGQGTEAPTSSITRVQPGDLWRIEGGHKLLCGDSCDEATVQRLLGPEVPFIMVTDPPYGVDYDPAWRDETGLGAGKRLGVSTNDDRTDWREAFQHFPGDVAYVWHGALDAGETIEALKSCGFEMRAQIIWAKPTFAISRGHYNWQHEACYYAVRKGRSAEWVGTDSETTLWKISLEYAGDSQHSAQKPVETAARAIRNHGNTRAYDMGDGETLIERGGDTLSIATRAIRNHAGTGALVYDPFLGSGTTLIAAHRERRACYGIELEPAYCDTVLQRAENEGLKVEKG